MAGCNQLDSGHGNGSGPRYLKRREMAAKFDVSERYLEQLAAKGLGPPTVKIGRAVRYPEDLADRWARDLLVKSEAKVAA